MIIKNGIGRILSKNIIATIKRQPNFGWRIVITFYEFTSEPYDHSGTWRWDHAAKLLNLQHYQKLAR